MGIVLVDYLVAIGKVVLSAKRRILDAKPGQAERYTPVTRLWLRFFGHLQRIPSPFLRTKVVGTLDTYCLIASSCIWSIKGRNGPGLKSTSRSFKAF